VCAHKIEGIGAGFIGASSGNSDDRLQQLVAVRSRFLGKFIIDRIPIFGTFALQQLERAPPNVVTAITQFGDDAGGKRILPKAFAPLAGQRVGSLKPGSHERLCSLASL